MTHAPLTVFCSYSHRDEDGLNQLRHHLAGLRRLGLIADWHDRQIPPGGNWDETISANLEAAELILLLISPDFIQSDYCMDRETPRALEREQAKTAIVIPIFWRECVIVGLPFTRLQGTPKDQHWITGQPNRDKAWAEVAEAIGRAARNRLEPEIAEPLVSKWQTQSELRFGRRRWAWLIGLLLISVLTWYVWQTQQPEVGERLLEQGEYQQARDVCTRADASSARDRCLRIVSLMLAEKDLETFFSDAEREDSAYGLTIRGEEAASRDDFRNAEKFYREAIQSNPLVAQAYAGLGQLYQMHGMPKQGLEWHLKAVDKAPNNRRFLHGLASVYMDLGDLSKAEDTYKQLLKLDGSQLLAAAELIQVLLRQGKKVEAKELAIEVDQNYRLHPEWRNALLNSQEWYVLLMDGQVQYLDSWDDKDAYLKLVFQTARQTN